MLRINELKLPLNHPEPALREAILARLGILDADLVDFTVYKRSYDARKKAAIVLIYSIDADVRNEAAVLARLSKDQHVMPSPDVDYKFVQVGKPAPGTPRPVVVGTGPCGLFVALILAQMGLNPIILERGKIVRERTVDTFGFWRKRKLNTESNVQFGEGGAGTFSDGKLYSQIKDSNHHGRKVLTEFVRFGAPEEIMYVSKPHIGTFRLVKMVEQMRAEIIRLGGEIRFETRVDDVLIEETGGVRQVVGVRLGNGEEIATRHLTMAIGHTRSR